LVYIFCRYFGRFRVVSADISALFCVHGRQYVGSPVVLRAIYCDFPVRVGVHADRSHGVDEPTHPGEVTADGT